MDDSEKMRLWFNFPVYLLVRNGNEFPLVNVNDEMQDCMPIFTSKELAELYVSEAGGGSDLMEFDDSERFTRFLRGFIRQHPITHYATNFTLRATSVKCGPWERRGDVAGGRSSPHELRC